MSPTRFINAFAAFAFRLLVAAGVVVALPTLTAAQDTGKVGLVASTGGNVGVIWNITEHLAILPTVGFSYTSTTSQVIDLVSGIVDPFDLELIEQRNAVFSAGMNIAAQITIAQPDAFRLYVSPSWGKNWSTAGEVLSESNYHVGGAFGARYAFNDRFSLFGETGIVYRRTTLELDVPELPLDIDFGKSTLRATGSASRLGVIIHF